jgi:hypothetical protein
MAFLAGAVKLAAIHMEIEAPAERIDPPITGLRCPSCKRPVATIENIVGGRVLMMRCPACSNSWSADPHDIPSSRER